MQRTTTSGEVPDPLSLTSRSAHPSPRIRGIAPDRGLIDSRDPKVAPRPHSDVVRACQPGGQRRAVQRPIEASAADQRVPHAGVRTVGGGLAAEPRSLRPCRRVMPTGAAAHNGAV